MEVKQEAEWLKAQKISVSVDLVSAAKQQLVFLAAVDKNRWLYEEPALGKAIYRYNACWLPLLAKHSESSTFDGPLVVPLDCEWIWHCHRLNPVRYNSDCLELYGSVLDNSHVVSSVQCVCTKQTEEVWNKLYPKEPFQLDMKRASSPLAANEKSITIEKCSKYDMVSAVKRQIPFTYQWENTFGSRYWKAGAMYRGAAPSPVTFSPFVSTLSSKESKQLKNCQDIIQLPQQNIVEVLLEIVGVKNLPEEHKGNLHVMFSKKQPDQFFNVKRKLTILSESREKQAVSFQCEAEGDLLLELVSHSPSKLPIAKEFKTVGTTLLSLENLLNPISRLAEETWLELLPASGKMTSFPISLTVPTQAPYVLDLTHPRSLSKGSCFFPLPGRVHHAKRWMDITNETSGETMSLQMRDSKQTKENEKRAPMKQVIWLMDSGETQTVAEFSDSQWSLMDSQWSLRLQSKSNKDGLVAEMIGCRMVRIFQGRKLDFESNNCEKWSSEQDFMTAVEFSTEHPYGNAVALMDLKSDIIKMNEEWLVLPGVISAFILSNILNNKEYESFTLNPEHSKEADELLHKGSAMKSGSGCGSGCGGGCGGNMVKTGGGCGSGCGSGCGGNMVKTGGGCGSGCGSGCGGNMVKTGGGCGSGCGSGCGGNMVKTGGGCGSGCGGSMAENGGNMVHTGGGCDSGCGGVCGGSTAENGGGCGSGCGSGCGGNMAKTGGGCGSGCGDGCGGGDSVVANSAIEGGPREARGLKKHLKRLNAPKHWMLDKLGGAFAPKPSSGPHKSRECLPLVLILRNRLKYALTYREVQSILMQRHVMVDNKVRTDKTFPAGFMDVVSIPKTNENFRMLYDSKGRFRLHSVRDEEANFKLCKVRNIQFGSKGIPYLNTYDGRTIRYPDPLIKANDTIKLDLESTKIVDFIKFDVGNVVMVTGGRNRGRVGILKNREKHKGSFETVHIQDSAGHEFATRLSNVFTIGKGSKPWVSLPKGKGIKLTIIEEAKKRIAAQTAA
ncbi:40S ribosomal protein S4 [Linum perenne]